MPSHIVKSELKVVGKKIVLTERQKIRLSKHRQRHIIRGNTVREVDKHMRVMNKLMIQGQTFKKSHTIAQEKYEMIN